MNATSRPPLRVGLIGFGYGSQTFHAPLITTTPGLALVAVSSRDPARVAQALGDEVRVAATPHELIARDDLDLIVVAAPNDAHHPLARAALLAGRHTVVDKPFTIDAPQAHELVALARARGLVLSTFHNRRWDGPMLTARRLLAEGRLGRVRHAALHFDRYRPQVRERWREAEGPGSGLWLDLGSHLLDGALQLFGWPVALQVDLARLREGARADDFFQARLRYADGLRVSLQGSMSAAQPGPRVSLQGTRGGYLKRGADPQEDALKAGARPDPARRDGWGRDPQPGELALADEGGQLEVQALPTQRGDYPAYYEQVRDAVLRLGPNPVPPEQALDVMTLLDLGRRSAQERRELDTPAPTGYAPAA